MQKKFDSLEREKKSLESETQRHREEIRSWRQLLTTIKKQEQRESNGTSFSLSHYSHFFSTSRR
jgi:prefoldin subunit 5